MADTLYDDYLNMPEDVSVGYELPEAPAILEEVANQAREMMSGPLPESVRKQTEQLAAESAAMQGLGIGKSAGARTLRDLGIKALEYQQAGMTLGAQVGGQQGSYAVESEKLRQASAVSEIDLAQRQRAANLRYIATKGELEQGGSKLALAAAELQALNMERRLQGENQLILQNSQYAVENLNQLMADAANYFTASNATADAIQSLYGV